MYSITVEYPDMGVNIIHQLDAEKIFVDFRSSVINYSVGLDNQSIPIYNVQDSKIMIERVI